MQRATNADNWEGREDGKAEGKKRRSCAIALMMTRKRRRRAERFDIPTLVAKHTRVATTGQLTWQYNTLVLYLVLDPTGPLVYPKYFFILFHLCSLLQILKLPAISFHFLFLFSSSAVQACQRFNKILFSFLYFFSVKAERGEVHRRHSVATEFFVWLFAMGTSIYVTLQNHVDIRIASCQLHV